AVQAVFDSGVYKGPAKIDLQLVPENEIDPKIRLEMISGAKTYDLAITEAGGARQYGGMGLLAPLPAPADWSDFFEGNRNQHSIGNTIYGYPILADNGVFYYNEAMVREAGFSGPPKTWDEFWRMAIRMTKDAGGKRADEAGFDPRRVIQYGLSFKGAPGAGNPWEFTYYLYGNGLHYIEKDYAKSTYQVTVNRPEIVAVLERILELKNRYGALPDGFSNYDYDENRQMFAQGRVAMIFDWPSAFVEVFLDSPQGKNIRITNLPKGTVNDSGPIGGWSVNAFKDSKNLQEAINVAQALTSKEGITIFARTQGSVPPRQSVMTALTAEYKANNPAVGTVYEVVGRALLTGQEMDLAQTLTASKDVVMAAAETLSAVFAGQKQPRAALDELNVTVEQTLIRNNYMK
ncbi:MAG: extracellular solute-binding protein, partial [Treponema sp.]|nr:extracellular solute-binding protein [Treponema sp.]